MSAARRFLVALVHAAALAALLVLPSGAARADAPRPPRDAAPAPVPAFPGAEGFSAGVDTPTVSGLAWRSGASEEAGFGDWRGRRLDVRVVFVEHDTWAEMLSFLRNGYFRDNCRQTPLCVVSMPSMPRSEYMQHQRCAGGEFDENHRQYAALVAAARPGAVVRPAWEANSGSGHPWRIGSAANIPAYKACFRRLAQLYKNAGLLIEWTNSKGGTVPYLDTYPGDDVVDLWGLHQYDNDAKGIVFADFVAEAASRGKKVGVGEWGLWTDGDNPDYVRRMFEQFRANASRLAYESYYNAKAEHMLHPRTRHPRAARAYRELWGG